MGEIAALILAAGQGTRFGGDTPKQFLKLSGKALWRLSLEAFLPFTDVIAVTTDEAHLPRISEECEDLRRAGDGCAEIYVAEGGDSRAESVLKGLRFLASLPEKPETVLIHDAARCLVTPEIIEACLQEARKTGAAIAAIPATDTIKAAEFPGNLEDGLPVIKDTPDRRSLYQAQTPQGFAFSLILSAYEKAEAEGALRSLTDDASAAERFTDHEVVLTPGSPENIKVTRPLDLAFAESILHFRISR